MRQDKWTSEYFGNISHKFWHIYLNFSPKDSPWNCLQNLLERALLTNNYGIISGKHHNAPNWVTFKAFLFAPFLLSYIKRLHGQFSNPWKALCIAWILFLLYCKFVWMKPFLCSALPPFWEPPVTVHQTLNFIQCKIIIYSDLLPSWRKMFFYLFDRSNTL